MTTDKPGTILLKITEITDHSLIGVVAVGETSTEKEILFGDIRTASIDRVNAGQSAAAAGLGIVTIYLVLFGFATAAFTI